MLKRFFHICVLVLLLNACGSREAQRLLDQAEAVINENSSEAITILDSISNDGLSRSQRMRRLLLLTNAHNKCDTVFRSDSIQKLLVNYYESHGTANERMLAHYLLGRAYQDIHDYPNALNNYQKAANHVYGKDKVELIGGWRVSNLHIDGVTLRDDRSGFKSAIYERTIDGVTEYVYATSGTDSDSYEDWKNNFLQVFGASEQYNISKENARVLSDNINQELTFVGHSLGGGMAATNAYKTGRSAMTFNAAWVSPLTIAPWTRKGAKIDAYVHVRDELNIFQQTHMGVRANGNIHWRNKNRAIMGHSIKNFYPSGKEMIMQKSKNAQSQYTLNTNNILFGF